MSISYYIPSTGYIARSLNHQQKEETMGERIVSNCGALKISKDDGTLPTKIQKFQMCPKKRSKTSATWEILRWCFTVNPPAGRKDEVINMIRVPKIHVTWLQLPTEMRGSRRIPPPNGTEKKLVGWGDRIFLRQLEGCGGATLQQP